MRYNLLFPIVLGLLAGVILPKAVTAQSPGEPGPFAESYKDLTFTDPLLNDPEVEVRIFYPATETGIDQPVAVGNFPVIAFGHGFNLNYLDYENLCFHLASWGFVVVSPNVQNGFNVDHLEYARELGACLDYIVAAGGNADSEFFQRILPVTGVYGHSMGGGASYLVPSVYPAVNAISGLAPAETNPSAIDALADYDGPLQIISGSEDSVTPEATNQQPMYDNAMGMKHWVSLTGGSHCKFTDATTICDLVSDPGTISREDQQAQTNLYTTAFFRFVLQEDESMLSWLCGDSIQANVDDGKIVLETSLECTITSTQQHQESTMEIYPNPAMDEVVFQEAGNLEVYSILGKRMITQPIIVGEEQRLNVSDWEPGIYIIRDTDLGTIGKLLKL